MTIDQIKATITAWLTAKAGMEAWHERVLFIGQQLLEPIWGKYSPVESWEPMIENGPFDLDCITIRFGRWCVGEKDEEDVTFPTAWLWLAEETVRIRIAQRLQDEAAEAARVESARKIAEEKRAYQERRAQYQRLKTEFDSIRNDQNPLDKSREV